MQQVTRWVLGVMAALVLGGVPTARAVGADCAGATCVYLPTVAVLVAPDTSLLPGPGVARLNRYRAAAGVRAVTEDLALSRGAALHLRYMLLNPDEFEHGEEPTRPGYTEEGDRAARESNLFRASPGTPESQAIDSWMESIFHRFGMLRPDLRTVGFAYGCDSQGCAGVLNVLADTGGDARPDGVTYPALNQRGVTTQLLSWQFGPFDPPVTLTSAALRDASGSAIPFTTRPANGFFNVVTVEPITPLAPGATYTVEMHLTQEGRTLDRAWSFRMRGTVNSAKGRR